MDNQETHIDIEAFEATALPHLDACYGLALRLTRNVDDAEDLVQEAFLRALRFFHRFEAGTNFRAWILKILMNTFINAYRKGSSRKEGPASHKLELLYERMPSPQGIDRTDDPERAAINQQMLSALQEALDKLPETFRTVVHLADIEGCSYKEIASITDCPIGTVMSRLHRGRRLLQAALVQFAPESRTKTNREDEDVAGTSAH
jgi:RNA polymerase sigma-70 factor (ECF subfamily)